MIAVPLASLMVKVSLLMGAERRNGESPAIPIGETTEEVGMVMWKIKARENMTSALRYFKMATSIKDETYSAETQMGLYGKDKQLQCTIGLLHQRALVTELCTI